MFARRSKQKIALIAIRISRSRKLRDTAFNRAADIVPGRHAVGAKIARRRQQVLELHRLVATHARDRRRAFQIRVCEVFHYLLAEAVLIIEHIMRNAERFSHAPRVMNVLARATRALLLQGGAMVIELQGHANDVIARIFQ